MKKFRFLVVGSNSRPIAVSAKRMGHRVYVVDYWGDQDLRKIADDVEAITTYGLGEHPSESEAPLSRKLVELAFKLAKKHKDIDYILVDSGFDDYPALWKSLAEIAPILGNKPRAVQKVRDRIGFLKHARKLGIGSPPTERISSIEDAISVADKFQYPIVLRPYATSGGFRLKLAENVDELRDAWKSISIDQRESAYIQKYVEGKLDVSVSILGDGEKCISVTANEQLIGLKELGVSAPFSYCGNIVPLEAEKDIVESIIRASLKLGEDFELVGSNGFDFIISPEGTPIIMECNPRFQGTLECIEAVSGLNLIEEHIRACLGDLRTAPVLINGCAVKLILFAREISRIPDLTKIDHIVDIPPTEAIVEKGEPICTVQLWNSSRDSAAKHAYEIAERVYSMLEPIES
ncbi:MAG: ATP-grasp domain-containing protein, partial [Candidatus Hodarchaeota archaeon]